jgi:hypothetical protein
VELELFWVDSSAVVVPLLMRVGMLRDEAVEKEEQLNF